MAHFATPFSSRGTPNLTAET